MLADIRDDSQGKWRFWARTVVLVLFGLFVLVALLGFFDQRRTETQTVPGLAATLEYPYTTRGGADIVLDLQVHSSQSLPETIEVALSTEYSKIFEDFAIHPVAQERSQSFDELRFEVSTGEQQTARIRIDGRVADSWQAASTGTLTLALSEREPIQFSIKTWRMP